MGKNKLTKFKEKTVEVAEQRIRDMQDNGEIKLPDDYAVGNALNSAWLKLQETTNRSGKPVLESCSKTSIVNALLDTAVQGLNPSKDQVYYIAYGNKLVAQRSYFGNIALAKRMADVKEVRTEVIRKGDKVKMEINNGNRQVVKHETEWDNSDNKIVGGYAVVTFNDDRPERHTVMTLDECKQAWKQGQTYKEGGNGTHQKFTQEMVKKTVANRATKPLIKSSSDSYLFKVSVDRADDTFTENMVEEEKEENANSEVIDIEKVEDDEEVEDISEDEEEEKEQDDFDKEVDEAIKGDNPF